MTAAVWKFAIEPLCAVLMPTGAKPLSVAFQGNTLHLWAVVDQNARPVKRKFGVYGTGHPLPDQLGEYVGTAFLEPDRLVFHVFDQGETE